MLSALLQTMCLTMRSFMRTVLIFLSIYSETKAQDSVHQPKGFHSAHEDDNIILECEYKTTSSNPTLLWYRQHNDSPKYILLKSKYGDGDTAAEFKSRFHSKLDSSSVSLIIQHLHVCDSAVYYCALYDVGVNKIIFGHGTKLIVESKEVQKPSFYKVTNDSCLATDFTQHNALDGEPAFSGQNISVRYDGEKTYSAFALGAGRICTETEGCKEGSSGQTVEVESDEKMNFMSLGIFWLRIVFLKTVVFNVLMTVKAWMS